MTCGDCGQPGHNRSTCPKLDARKRRSSPPTQRTVTCSRCDRTGHNAAGCQNTDINTCSNCHRRGHNIRTCPD